MRIAVFALLLPLAVNSRAAEPQKPTVDRTARWFRIQVYETYRTERAEYDRRRALGDQLLREWENAGNPEEPAAQMIEWFLAARDASLPDAQAQLPAVPSIDFKQYAKANSRVIPEPAAQQAATRPAQETQSQAVPSDTSNNVATITAPADSTHETSEPPATDNASTHSESTDQALADKAPAHSAAHSEAADVADSGESAVPASSAIRSLGGAIWRAMTD
jgi:hypothetical protein